MTASPVPVPRRAWARHACALGLVALLAACGRGAAPPPAAAHAPAPADRPDPALVVVDEALARRLVVGPVAERPVAETIAIAGRLEVDAYRTARIGAPIAGRITRIDARFGQQVREGQVLAEISSPELAQAQLAYLRAHSQQQLNTRAVERAQLLLAADVIGSAEVQRRQNELDVSSAEKRAAADQLRALGLSARTIAQLERTGELRPGTHVTASLGGTVIDLKVAQGQVVNPSDVLFVVSDLSQLWAQAEVPEQDAQFVRNGQRVVIEIPALDNERVVGEVTYVADLVNPQTRTVRVGVNLANRERRLKPSMLITMLIESRASPAQVVPETAIVRDANRDHVFVQVAPGRYRLTPVEAGVARDGVRALRTPLPPGSTVVHDGAFHLNAVREQRLTAG